MKSGLLRIVVILVILAGCSACALAQYEAADKARLGVALSFERPTDSALSKIKGTWMGVDVDLHVTYDKDQRPNGIVSFSWYGNTSGLSSATLYPIRANYIKRFGESEYGGWYVGGGPIICFANFKTVDFDPVVKDFVSANDSGIKPGIGVVFGLEFGGSWFAEARYDKIAPIDRANGSTVDLSAFGVAIGTRIGL